MSGYNLPAFNPHKKTLEKRLVKKGTQQNNENRTPPGMREDALRIAKSTGASVEIISDVLGRALVSGATVSAVEALARTSRLRLALQDTFSWTNFNALTLIAAGDAAFLERLLEADMSPDEARKISPSNEETNSALDFLGFLS